MNRLYIVGLPGAGKSVLAREMAGHMGWDLVDTDAEIERIHGSTVEEIIEVEGEAVFRSLEKKALLDTARLENTIVSCGGGAVAFENNMEWMLGHGLTLFLNPPIEMIVRNLAGSAQKRPMFRGLDEAGIRAKLLQLVDERGDLYSKSKIVWNRNTAGSMLYHAVKQLISLKLAWP